MRILKFCLLAGWICLRCSAQHPAASENLGKANKLISAQSPYLLQHAYNPVDWYPWGDEAMEKASQDEKLLLISIGYAACHWCHVMERESFEDDSVAALMNANFVSVKVDREERPDVDGIYMNACELLSRGGCGWPLNIIALPNGKPIFAGTYFSKEQWMNILQRVKQVYEETPEKALDLAEQLTDQLQVMQGVNLPSSVAMDLESWEQIAQTLIQSMDPKLGGRKGAPKFPMPNNLLYLLEYYTLSRDAQALEIVQTTLDYMAQYGLYDHLGGGFARYSTDEAWKVPHFEKMLYDNSQLVSLYAKAYQATGNPAYKRIVEEVLSYVEREMSSENGGFFSTLDADSEGEEGKFYIWSMEEINSLLGDQAKIFSKYFQCTAEGNWEDGKNILWRLAPADVERLAEENSLSIDQLIQNMDKAKSILFDARTARTKPGLDDKQITAWNALMIKGYIDAYRALGNESYLQKALESTQFILANCQESSGRLNRIYKGGKSSINAFLDDYSFLAEACIGLYEATFEEKWLNEAKRLAEYTIEQFGDEQTDMFFYTSNQDDPLLTRTRVTTDNVIPSSNSSMARVLFLLGTYFYQPKWVERSEKMLARMQEVTAEQPGFFSNWARLTTLMVFPPYEVAILGPEAQKKRAEMDQNFLPNVLFLGGESEGELALLENKLVNGQTTIYVCTNKVCKLPVREASAALKLIE
ncbi:MAG: thioredoxin domain-containing protein [Bacteroidota bacterium]